jgi:hypothetical protein
MGAQVDQTRNTYFIHWFKSPEEADAAGATVGEFPEDWPEVDDEISNNSQRNNGAPASKNNLID